MMIITFNGSHNDDTGEEKKYNNHYREDNFDNVYDANEKKILIIMMTLLMIRILIIAVLSW